MTFLSQVHKVTHGHARLCTVQRTKYRLTCFKKLLFISFSYQRLNCRYCSPDLRHLSFMLEGIKKGNMASCVLICFSSYQIAAVQLFHFVSVNRKINALCKYWFTHRYNKDSQIPISFKTLTFGICQCFNDISALNELYWILIHKREGRKYVLKKRLVFQELIMFKCSKTFPTSVKEHGE